MEEAVTRSGWGPVVGFCEHGDEPGNTDFGYHRRSVQQALLTSACVREIISLDVAVCGVSQQPSGSDGANLFLRSKTCIGVAVCRLDAY